MTQAADLVTDAHREQAHALLAAAVIGWPASAAEANLISHFALAERTLALALALEDKGRVTRLPAVIRPEPLPPRRFYGVLPPRRAPTLDPKARAAGERADD